MMSDEKELTADEVKLYDSVQELIHNYMAKVDAGMMGGIFHGAVHEDHPEYHQFLKGFIIDHNSATNWPIMKTRTVNDE